MTHWFACEIEERVRPAGRATPSETRRERGFARTEGTEETGFEIEAATDPLDWRCRSMETALDLSPAIDLSSLPDNVAIRTIERVAISCSGERSHATRIQLVVLSANGESILATPDNLEAACRFVDGLARREPTDQVPDQPIAMAWMNGSASVLLHEAVGHPAERSVFSREYPEWLEVVDHPASGTLLNLGTDDTGRRASDADLTQGERPAMFRRWSYRDVPMRRLTNLVARAKGGERVSLPSRRIEIFLVGHGQWDALSDEIAVRVAAADLVDGPHRSSLAPFVFRTPRILVPKLIRGWFGTVETHPGVLCGDEGMTLPVGSASIGLLMERQS